MFLSQTKNSWHQSVLGCLFMRESMKRAVFRITSPVTAVRPCWSNVTGCLAFPKGPMGFAQTNRFLHL